MTGAHTPSVADVPAFPIPDERDADGCGIREGSRGMTLRDYFAGQALAGLAGSSGKMREAIVALANEDGITTTEIIADLSYEHADAMLIARAHSTKENHDG